jgi:hypothetical protein
MLDTKTSKLQRRGSASPFKSGFQWGCALWAKGRTMGLAQNLEGLNGEAEPRLTSGGTAATLPTRGLFVQRRLMESK